MAKDKESDRGYGVVLKTGISEAFWCQRDGEFARFGPAEVAIGGTEPAAIAWFDELFRGGIYVPKSKSRPLTILITGPPGSGKTTLTLELCYRMAKNSGAFSLYLSTESEEQTLINNAKAYGYADVNKIIKPFHAYTPAQATVTVREVQGFQNSNGLAKTIADTLQELTKWLTKAPPGLAEVPVRGGVNRPRCHARPGTILAPAEAARSTNAAVGGQAEIPSRQHERRQPVSIDNADDVLPGVPDAGQTAHDMVRWLSIRGEASSWSETASATIGACGPCFDAWVILLDKVTRPLGSVRCCCGVARTTTP